MSRTINKVELLGRVGVDPEMQYTPNGTAVTKLRLATDRYRKEGENGTDWHNLVVWGATAEAVNQYVSKGQRIYVAGRLVQNSWENEDGQPRPPHRGPRLRGRLPRRQRERRRRSVERRLPLRVGAPTASERRRPLHTGRITHGAFPIYRGRPRPLF